MKEIIITENEKEQRIDRFLTKYLDNTTKTNIFKLIRKKRIRINGTRVKENYFLQEGDVLSIHLHENQILEMQKEEKLITAEEVDLDIVYEDDEILIVNKPSGLLTHPDSKEYKKALSSKVNIYLKHLSTRTFKPASVNRLDKNTSGLVLYCKTYDSLKKYNKMMRERKIGKFYKTIVCGVPKKEGEVSGYLLREERRVTIHKHEIEDSKFVHTKYKVLATNGEYSLLDIELLTGRTHQIRASLSYIGYPILGDVRYKGDRIKDNYQLLHAYKMIIDGKEYIKDSDEIQEYTKKLNID